jgi:Derlin-2/3
MVNDRSIFFPAVIVYLPIYLMQLYNIFSSSSVIYTPWFLNMMHYRHKIVARFRIGVQANATVRPANTGPSAFRGRGYRLNQ